MIMFCPKCGTKLEPNYNCCPVCSAPTLNEQIIIRNADKQGCFGFFSGCVTWPITFIVVCAFLSAAISVFEGLAKYKAISIPIAIIAFAIYLKWDWIKDKYHNVT